MQETVPSEGYNLGEKLKYYRQQRRLSLAELAARSGISKSLISQVERSVVNPSVATIRSLAKGLEIPVFLFFMDDFPSTDLVRRDLRRRVFLPGSDVEREFLTPAHRHKIVLLTMNLASGQASGPEFTQHTGEECVYVRKGSLIVRLGDQEVVLEEGDSLYFDAIIPHQFFNGGPFSAEVISCIAPGVND